MKNRLLVLVIIVMTLLLTACGNAAGGGGIASNNSVGTTSNTDTQPDELGEVISHPGTGISIKTPPTYLANQDKVYLHTTGGEYAVGLYGLFYYLYPENFETLSKMTEAEFKPLEKFIANPLTLIRVDEDWDAESLSDWLMQAMDTEDVEFEEVKKEGEYTVYVMKDETISEDLPTELKPIYEGIINELLEAKGDVELTEPLGEGSENIGQTLSFTTTDVDGNEVKSEDIFSKNKYTMINCWASWCGPCVGEMPKLEELNKNFEEEGCGIVGILIDGNGASGLSDGKEIIADTGVTYLNIVPWEGFEEELGITAFPTTFFVDSNGMIVGETIVGAAPRKYEKALKRLLE